jgi:lipopolysaccharide transport system ATP-binding protein
MNDLAIIAEDISKRYRIGTGTSANGHKRSLLRKVASTFDYLASTLREPSEAETLWALRDISFTVKEGEVIGLIGRNGAGKSTLLKVLSRITEPTGGRALIKGRVGSLLEVGTGFHPELTGRENIFLSGAILGMRRAEIERKFDEIVAFAEIERFLDTQVKRYSSGMYVRLAFAVAAHLEPEVLLVDEVLAVGDAAFQRKCLGKMGDVATQGRTIVFVSHNMVAVQNLCERALWLNNGRIAAEGDTNDVVSQYLSAASQALTERIWPDKEGAPGNDKVRLHRVCVRPQEGSPEDRIDLATSFVIEADFWNLEEGACLHPVLHFFNEQEVITFTSSPIDVIPDAVEQKLPVGLIRTVCHVPAHFLNVGLHRVVLLMLRNTSKIMYRYEDAVSFEIFEMGERAGAWYGKEPGVMRPILEWQTVYP